MDMAVTSLASVAIAEAIALETTVARTAFTPAASPHGVGVVRTATATAIQSPAIGGVMELGTCKSTGVHCTSETGSTLKASETDPQMHCMAQPTTRRGTVESV